MNKILIPENAIEISKTLRKEGKKLVLAGGCFDILHVGHVLFLENAKKEGDILMVLLESDASIQKAKGQDHPIHAQSDRGILLSALSGVDYVVLLPHFETNKMYDSLVLQLKPAIIAATSGDEAIHHKIRQAKILGIPIVEVIKRIPNNSSSNLAKIITRTY